MESVSFAEHTLEKGNDQAVFGGKDQNASLDNTLTIYTSAEGAAGSKVSVHKSVLLSALTFSTQAGADGNRASVGFASGDNASGNGDETEVFDATFATQSGGDYLDLQDISVGVISQALENIAFFTCSEWWGAFPPGLQLGILDSAKDQYACGSWTNGRCGHCRGDNKPGEIFGTLSGICKHAGPSQCQHRDRPDASAITRKTKR